VVRLIGNPVMLTPRRARERGPGPGFVNNIGITPGLIFAALFLPEMIE
jgi:hypothetical protein